MPVQPWFPTSEMTDAARSWWDEWTVFEPHPVDLQPDEDCLPAPKFPNWRACQPPTPAELIDDECNEVREMLLVKNEKYGNSALQPARVFSRASPVEQILVRIDDKISRLRAVGTGEMPDEDTVKDLIGYLILLRVAQRQGEGQMAAAA